MFNKEKFNELNSRISYKDEQNVLGISNRYFTELLKLANNKVLKASHIPFTFSYLYLQTYLFRYTKYDNYVPSVGEVKEILTYNKTNTMLNYIIKDGGILDTYNLTKTLYDFPIIHEWDGDTLEFTLLSHFNDGSGYGRQWRKDKGINFNSNCKYPVLGFYDDLESFDEVSMNNYGGTFFNTYNLTLIEWNIFNYCMSHSELGCTGFYLYSFVKWQEGLNGNCQMGLSLLSKLTGLSTSSISRYMKPLREHNLVECVSGTYIVNADARRKDDEDIQKESNTYFANEFSKITDNKSEITRPDFISMEHYRDKKKLESDNTAQIPDAIEFDELFG